MATKTKKVILVGSSGCGKTTLYQFLTGGAESVETKSTRTLHCAWSVLKDHPEIVVVDTPGLESDDEEWWEEIQPHQHINMVIIMFNGTNDRLQNLNKLNYVYNYLQTTKTHLKVLAIKGNNFEHDGFEYEFLADHTGRVKFNEHFTSSSCLGQTTRDDIYRLIVNNTPDDQIELFSPIKMIAALDKKKQELAEAVQRCAVLDESLQQTQKLYAFTSSAYEKLRAEHDTLIVNSNGVDIALQRARSQLVSEFCVVEQDGSVKAKVDGWGWHFVSWLPFAGNIQLARKRVTEERAANIAKEILQQPVVRPSAPSAPAPAAAAVSATSVPIAAVSATSVPIADSVPIDGESETTNNENANSNSNSNSNGGSGDDDVTGVVNTSDDVTPDYDMNFTDDTTAFF